MTKILLILGGMVAVSGAANLFLLRSIGSLRRERRELMERLRTAKRDYAAAIKLTNEQQSIRAEAEAEKKKVAETAYENLEDRADSLFD